MKLEYTFSNFEPLPIFVNNFVANDLFRPWPAITGCL